MLGDIGSDHGFGRGICFGSKLHVLLVQKTVMGVNSEKVCRTVRVCLALYMAGLEVE